MGPGGHTLCCDNTDSITDTDSNGSWEYCPAAPCNWTEDNGDDFSDLSDLPDTDIDYLADLDDDNTTSDGDITLDSTTKIRLKKIRIRLKRLNGPFWRHIRNLYHQQMSAEAIQEMLNWGQKNGL